MQADPYKGVLHIGGGQTTGWNVYNTNSGNLIQHRTFDGDTSAIYFAGAQSNYNTGQVYVATTNGLAFTIDNTGAIGDQIYTGPGWTITGVIYPLGNYYLTGISESTQEHFLLNPYWSTGALNPILYNGDIVAIASTFGSNRRIFVAYDNGTELKIRASINSQSGGTAPFNLMLTMPSEHLVQMSADQNGVTLLFEDRICFYSLSGILSNTYFINAGLSFEKDIYSNAIYLLTSNEIVKLNSDFTWAASLPNSNGYSKIALVMNY